MKVGSVLVKFATVRQLRKQHNGRASPRVEGQHYQIQGKDWGSLTPKLESESLRWPLGKSVGICASNNPPLCGGYRNNVR